MENLVKESEGKSKDIIMARNRIAELENQLATNIESALLQQEIFIQKSNLEYAEKMEKAQLERRQKAEAILFGSEIYLAVKKKVEEGKAMNTTDWQAFETVINEAYPCFSARLRELSKLSEQELHVSLLLKARFTNKDIATLCYFTCLVNQQKSFLDTIWPLGRDAMQIAALRKEPSCDGIGRYDYFCLIVDFQKIF